MIDVFALARGDCDLLDDLVHEVRHDDRILAVERDARLLLRDLNEHATQPKYVYVHRWKRHDLLIWDNRQTMHRVRRYDDNYPRDMRRTTVAGEEMTTAQVN